MSDFSAPQVDWAAISPIVTVLGAGVVGVLVEAFVPARARRTVQVTLSLAATAGALLAVALLWDGVRKDGGTSVLRGSILVDGPTLVLQATIALLALLSILVMADRTETGEDAFAPSAAAVPGSDYEQLARRRGVRQTEVYPLVLLATGGMLIFPAAGDLLTLFVALEVLSLPLYLLTGMARRRRLLSQEASMKYFLLGAFASALFLFGIALVYGYCGSLSYSEIASAVQTPTSLDTLLLVGAVLILAGLLFKVGAVPFHTWTPDVYQGAPTPITGFMAACTKVAAFGALLRVVYTVFPDLQWDLNVVMWTVAIATMVVGTGIALVQTDIKRILAYSSIAHAGFILTGIVPVEHEGITAVLFYLLVYGAATVGSFGIVWLVREKVGDEILGEATHVSQWAGLGRRHPAIALAFGFFLLSFAGIPLTAGFAGKFGVFSAAVAGGDWPLALIGVLSSSAAAFFYVRIIVIMFFTAPAGERDEVVGDGGGAAAASWAPGARVPGAVAAAAAVPVGAGIEALEVGEPALVASGGVALAVREDEVAPAATAAVTTTVVRTEGFAIVAIVVCLAITVVLGIAPSPVVTAISHVAHFLP